MSISRRAQRRREQAEDEVEALGGGARQRQNRSAAPLQEPPCGASKYGRCWFTVQKFDPASGRPRAACFYCGTFEYEWVKTRDAMRAEAVHASK